MQYQWDVAKSSVSFSINMFPLPYKSVLYAPGLRYQYKVQKFNVLFIKLYSRYKLWTGWSQTKTNPSADRFQYTCWMTGLGMKLRTESDRLTPGLQQLLHGSLMLAQLWLMVAPTNLLEDYCQARAHLQIHLHIQVGTNLPTM